MDRPTYKASEEFGAIKWGGVDDLTWAPIDSPSKYVEELCPIKQYTQSSGAELSWVHCTACHVDTTISITSIRKV